MPRRDGTGPMGMDALTGRGFGTRKNNFIYGRENCYGLGLGYGLGRCRYGYETNRDLLQKEKEILQFKLKAIEKQIDEQ